MSEESTKFEELTKFIADYNKFGASYIATNLGIPRTIVGNGAALLGALGFNIESRSPAHKKVDFNTKVVDHLFDKGVSAKEIAEHLGVKKLSITSYLKRVGKIAKPVPLNDVLAAEAAAAEQG